MSEPPGPPIHRGAGLEPPGPPIPRGAGPEPPGPPGPVWPVTLGEFWSWHLQAARRQVDTALFFSPEGERGPSKERREAAAKQVCGSCQVVELCAAYAIATREPYGTWGGLSEHDRRQLLRDMDPRMAQLRYRAALAAWEPTGGAAGRSR